MNAELPVWITAVGAAKGRTSDNLGTNYPKISQQLWTAVQNALTGGKSPSAAMSAVKLRPAVAAAKVPSSVPEVVGRMSTPENL